MLLNDAIHQRRSVKHFDPNVTIPDEEIEKIFDLAIQSPSSFNLQHWRIVNVTDKDIRQKICELSWNQAQVTEASHLFILCADMNTCDKYADLCWKEAPEQAQNMMLSMIKKFYHGNEQLRRDEAIRSVSIFAQTLMLAVKGAGYDSCPMIGFDNDAVSDLINLPKDHVIGMMLPVGKAKSPAHPKSGYLPMDKIFIENKWGK